MERNDPESDFTRLGVYEAWRAGLPSDYSPRAWEILEAGVAFAYCPASVSAERVGWMLERLTSTDAITAHEERVRYEQAKAQRDELLQARVTWGQTLAQSESARQSLQALHDQTTRYLTEERHKVKALKFLLREKVRAEQIEERHALERTFYLLDFPSEVDLPLDVDD